MLDHVGPNTISHIKTYIVYIWSLTLIKLLFALHSQFVPPPTLLVALKIVTDPVYLETMVKSYVSVPPNFFHVITILIKTQVPHCLKIWPNKVYKA